MLFDRQSGGLGFLQVRKSVPTDPTRLHPLPSASSWQPSLPKASFSSLGSTELVTRKSLKRSRPLEETDRLGECVSRKKRRLRHELVTSRLSRPYATPATHIARGAWRLGVWARQRLSGGLLLRKGAILNSIAKKRKKAVLESTKKVALHEANLAPTSHSTPSHDPPSHATLKPLSVFSSSDYDAFDYEENQPIEDEEDEENSPGDNQPVYSDFRMLGSSDSDEELGGASYSFDTLDTSCYLGVDHGEKAIHLVMENERQDEVSVAPVTLGNLPSPLPGVVAVEV